MNLHQLVSLADGGETLCLVCLQTWQTYPYSAQCPGVPVLTFWPEPLMSKRQLSRFGVTTFPDDLRVCIYNDGEYGRYLFNPASFGLTVIPAKGELMTRDELHEAGYSTAKTKIPAPVGIWKSGYTWHALYNPADAQTRDHNPARKRALRQANLMRGHTDDLRVAAWYAYGGRVNNLRIEHRNGRRRRSGGFSPASYRVRGDYVYLTDEGKARTMRLSENLGSNREDAFNELARIARVHGVEIDWEAVKQWS